MVFKIQSKTGRIYEGEGYCVDPSTKSIVLKAADGELIIINPLNIASISGTPVVFATPDVSDLTLNTSELRAQEEAALRAAEKALESLNHRVSGDVQALYDRMSKLFTNCAWTDNDSFLILDDYLVEPPNYDQVRIRRGREGAASAGFARISRMLEGERKKLKM